MSLHTCKGAEHGRHTFQREGRALICRWCRMTREQIRAEAQRIGAAHIEQARERLALTPDQIAELDKLKPYQERRRRFAALMAAIENVAAFQFDKLPPPVPADARADVAAAIAALDKALAAITEPSIREGLHLARTIADAKLAHMQARWDAFHRRSAAA